MKRRVDYDFLRIFSMFGVIFLHSAASALRMLDHPYLWNFTNVLVDLFTPAVPLFFMMSGALLLSSDKTEELPNLFRHRLPKVLLPLVCWSLLAVAATWIASGGQEAITKLTHALNTPVKVPYWFLYALIPMYLLSPLLKKMVNGLTDHLWTYMMALWVFLTLGLYTVRSFIPYDFQYLAQEHWTLNVNMVGGYLGYFLLGAYLERLKRVPSKRALAITVAVMLAVSVLGTRWDTFAHGAYSDRFTNYLSLFTFVLSAALFLLFKQCFRDKAVRGRLVPLLSGLSFPIYLLHPLAIGLMEQVWGRLVNIMGPVSVVQLVVFYLAVTVICLAGAFVISSLKPLCYPLTGQKFADACRSCNLFALISRKKVDKD